MLLLNSVDFKKSTHCSVICNIIFVHLYRYIHNSSISLIFFRFTCFAVVSWVVFSYFLTYFWGSFLSCSLIILFSCSLVLFFSRIHFYVVELRIRNEEWCVRVHANEQLVSSRWRIKSHHRYVRTLLTLFSDELKRTVFTSSAIFSKPI